MNPYKNRRPRAQDLHKAILSNEYNSCAETYKSFFESVPFRYKNLNAHFWKTLFETVKSGHRNFELDLAIKKTEYTALCSGEWIELSMWLLSFGFFDESIACRQNSYKTIKTRKEKLIYNYYHSQLLLQALSDQGRWEDATNLIHESCSLQHCSPFERAILLGDKSVGHDIDKAYNSMISGKNVAVVGPLTFDQDYSAEIESADIIVELNAINSTRENIKTKYHGHPDIIYYNNSRNLLNQRSNFVDVPLGAKYIVIKNDKYKKELSKISKCRVTPSSSTWTWNGSFSMMETVLSDLLLFNPAQIKVYGVDLYTSFNYDKSYSNKPAGSMDGITFNFTVHDIFTQFLFMKHLFSNKRVIGDVRLSNVLSMSIEEYGEVLKRNHPVYIGEDINRLHFEKNILLKSKRD